MRIEISFRINAAPEIVFQYLVEPDKMVMAWPNSLRSIEVEGGGPFRLGSRYEARCMSGAKTYTTIGEVTAYRQDEIVECRVSSRSASGVNRQTLKPEGTSTVVFYEAQTSYGGPLGVALAPIARRRLRRDCQTFRRIVEANSGASA
jgi:carbon monoxide dehydrogenase subunit G